MGTLIQNGTIVNADGQYRADVLLEGETIAEIGTGISPAQHTLVDASGLLVMPGGVDVHTHLDMPFGGTVSADDYRTGTIAAAVGGTTTVIDFALQSKGHTMREALDTWLAKSRGKACIDYSLHMAITDLGPGDGAVGLAEMEAMVEEGISSFKLFMAYPNVLMIDDGLMFKVMEKAASLKALCCIHAENGSAIDVVVARMIAEGKTAPHFHALSRSTRAEAEATHRAIALADMAGCSVYIVHLSNEDALRELKHAKERGLRALAETCPQYLVLSLEDQMPGVSWEEAKYVFTPPLREKRNQDPLWHALRDGSLSVVSTDHCPFRFADQKSLGKSDFTKIPNGGPGIENRLQILWHFGVNAGRISPERFVELCSTAPARIFGMPQKGRIAPGLDADLLLWDPSASYTISAATQSMATDYSMFEGWTVRGNAKHVYSRGDLVVQDGRVDRCCRSRTLPQTSGKRRSNRITPLPNLREARMKSMSPTETPTEPVAADAQKLNSQQVIDLTRQYNYGTWRYQKSWNPMHIVDAEGCYLIDGKGKRFLDFSSQLVCSNLGYKNQAVINSIAHQAQQLSYAMPSYATEPRAELSQLLTEVLPEGINKFFFCTSGTEANEAAFKIARLYTGKSKIIARYRSYHGSTSGSIAATGDARRWPSEPSAKGHGVIFGPEVHCYKCPIGHTYPGCNIACADYLEHMIRNESDVAAVLVEPIVGTNGVIVPPPEYMPRLRLICDKHGVLLIADEVMSGWGRSGEWFAMNHWGVTPDILVTAKGITGAYAPLGLCATSEKIATFFDDHLFAHGHTYEAHPLTLAPAVATIREMHRLGLVERARDLGPYVEGKLNELKARHPSVGDVRGKGLFWAVDLVRNRVTREPFNTYAEKIAGKPLLVDQIAAKMLADEVIILAWVSHLIIAPPLIVTKGEIDLGIAALDRHLAMADVLVENDATAPDINTPRG